MNFDKNKYGNRNQNISNYNANINLNLFNAINYINYLNIQLEKIIKNHNDFLKIKENGLKELYNINNINNYLVNNNFNSNFFYPYNLLQLLNNANFLKNKDNFQITFKSKTNDPLIEKIQKFNISTKYTKNNNNNKDTKISENNIINIEDILSGKEKRTVVRISPIPPNYSSFDVSKLLDKYLKIENHKNQRIYKALFAPLSKIIGKNLGYCFVMLVSPKYVIKFYETFNGKSFNKKKCKKPCNVVWANLQGDDFLKVSDDPLRSPIIFSDTIIV